MVGIELKAKDEEYRIFVETLNESFEKSLSDITPIDLEELKEFLDNVRSSAVTYAKMRGDWEFLTRERRIERDDTRTSLHDEFILSLKILLRRMDQLHMPKANELLKEVESHERKWIGDLACYIMYQIGVSNR